LGTWVLSGWGEGGGSLCVKLTTHFHLVPRLRISSSFMARTGTTILLTSLHPTMLHSQPVSTVCEQASISNLTNCIHPSPDV
jgi:hypothetical protein